MSGPYDRPDAGELVAAVREFLEGDVMAATDGRVRFHARVAANALALVERELALSAAATTAQRQRFDALGVADERELGAAIRSGAMDPLWAEVVSAVRASVVDKLAVAHPGYTSLDE